MPRKTMILQSEVPYHVGARCINQEWFNVPLEDVWSIMSDQLYFIHHAYGVRLHAFVLMNNHFHLILRTPQSNLSEAMGWFMRETSRSLTRAGNRINQTYGGRYFRSVLGSPLYFLHAYKYVYLNPVKAGLVRHAVEYPYSTLHGLVGFRHSIIPLEEDVTLMSDFEGTLKWLNNVPDDETWTAAGRALRRPLCHFPKVDKQAHALESNAL